MFHVPQNLYNMQHESLARLCMLLAHRPIAIDRWPRGVRLKGPRGKRSTCRGFACAGVLYGSALSRCRAALAAAQMRARIQC
eukprot:scaffold8850_cov134-Isochrysis_galbana.AAC.14